MPLTDLPLALDGAAPPADVRRFLRESRRRIRRFQRSRSCPAFAGCDFVSVYAALRAVAAGPALGGGYFCEWGSGFGVVACLAATLGLDAWGIEAEGELVEAARRLAARFDLPTQFVRGSYIPAGAEEALTRGREFSWLSRAGRSAYGPMGLGPEEFDLIFAYPWPDEESLVADLFSGHSRPGALLLTYHADGYLRLRRRG